MPFATLPVRFFVNQYNEDTEDTLIEVSEHDFIMADGVITYDRHTVSENGVNQICLTKYPEGMLAC